jgi:predicted amidophosphoribosyltransferase
MKAEYQADDPCPECGSWYRNINHQCNICGKQLAAPGQHGRLWNKKRHRYLTKKEIKSGIKGG